MQGTRYTTALFVTVALFSACKATPQPRPPRIASKEERDYLEMKKLALDLPTTKAALEFAKIPLVITGVIVNGTGETGIILNKKVFQEGDWISDQLFLKAVHRDGAEFVYKGFTIRKAFAGRRP